MKPTPNTSDDILLYAEGFKQGQIDALVTTYPSLTEESKHLEHNINQRANMIAMQHDPLSNGYVSGFTDTRRIAFLHLHSFKLH